MHPGTRPVTSVVLDTNGRPVDRLLIKKCWEFFIFCLTAFHTLSLVYFPLLHFLLPHFQYNKMCSITRVGQARPMRWKNGGIFIYVYRHFHCFEKRMHKRFLCNFVANVAFIYVKLGTETTVVAHWRVPSVSQSVVCAVGRGHGQSQRLVRCLRHWRLVAGDRWPWPTHVASASINTAAPADDRSVQGQNELAVPVLKHPSWNKI